jgi:predicted dehydrogenase
VTLRIGVLGASRIAEQAIVGPAAELGHRLVAVAARDLQRATAFATKHHVEKVLEGYQAVLDDPEVDVIYNPLANALHAPWNLAAIAAGKPVLTEKPFARNKTEAVAVAQAAEAAGVTVLEGFHYFFHPVMQRAYAVAGGGEMGEITRVEVRMAMPTPADSDPRWSLELAGGALMDLGCYGLHIMRSLGRLDADGLRGRPSVLRAHADERSPGVDAWCDVELAFPGGATALAERFA